MIYMGKILCEMCSVQFHNFIRFYINDEMHFLFYEIWWMDFVTQNRTSRKYLSLIFDLHVSQYLRSC